MAGTLNKKKPSITIHSLTDKLILINMLGVGKSVQDAFISERKIIVPIYQGWHSLIRTYMDESFIELRSSFNGIHLKFFSSSVYEG